MNKFLSASFVLLISAMAVSAPTFAATTASVNVSASVTDVLSLTVAVKELDGAGFPSGPDVGTTMNFGALIKDGTNAQWGSKSFGVFLTANTSGRRYTIAGTMPPPTNGTVNLPNATLLKVIGATKGDVDIAGDVFNASAQAAVMTNSTIYTSSNAGDASVVNLVYGISGGNSDGSIPFPGWVGIPHDFAGGEYSSSVSYSLVLI